ncbi:uncharacterized protein LOC131314132 [Rhododendron vialii]|uniref:uncharacterized protein LOC131314132 n=1 Tax=Rhododendron vialii TaxID=182163 RepID=UPI00265EA0AC|nr:uncharacterized protein LOC131314132 [Rhododendron vialii]
MGCDPKKTEHLLSLEGAKERLHLFKANLLEEGSFDAAIDGCIGVFHTASPFFMDVFTNFFLDQNRQRFRETMPTTKIRANAAMSPQDGSVILELHRKRNGSRVKHEIGDKKDEEWKRFFHQSSTIDLSL